MPDATLVSIVTPSFNQSAYLEAAMRSVLAQQVAGADKIQIEYILVDGGSQDGSLEIIRRYSDRLAWWVSEPDSGQAEAINKGLSRASGEVVAWLNSDDLYLPGAVCGAVAVLRDNPDVGLVFANAITIDSNGRPLKRLDFGDWGLPELMKFRIICQPAVFMRRSVLEKTGLLDSSFHFMLDHQLWLRFARMAPIRHVAETWAAARHHLEAKNVSQPVEFGRETLRILEWMESQPNLAPLFKQYRRQIKGGAYRLNARYLLDGGQAGAALKSYAKALIFDPPFALIHWRRMLYASACLAGLQSLAGGYFNRRYQHSPNLSNIPGLEGWPGLCLES